ncbi:MAG: VIT and VWA domain-containing protein [Opitutaceae bacterium]|jgi:Ca-activated chloride channel family protein|nr:VIT and VWA domain-containing protein [Opitutaceae bacterium]
MLARMKKHFSHTSDKKNFSLLFTVGLLIGLLAIAVTVLGAPGRNADVDDDDISLSPYFQVKGAGDGVDALPLKSTQVDAVLAGIIAEVRVVQTYQNDGATPLEARYIFPASTRAAVHGMTMTVGERRIEAQIKEKEAARKTYEKARREGKTASLLESHRSNVFEMNVANILPGDTVTVELRYNELLVPEDGEYEWIFPTVVGPRYTKKAAKPGPEKTDAKSDVMETIPNPPVANPPAGSSPAANPFAGTKRLGGEGIPYLRTNSNSNGNGGNGNGSDGENEPVFTLTADVIAGTRVKKVKCVSHRVETSGTDGGVRVTLPPRAGTAMNRDFILRYRLAGESLAGGLMLDEFKGEKYFLLTVQPPARVEKAMIPPRDYVFVMDVSGSMWGFPLDVSQRLLKELLINLRDADTFNVLLFSGSSRALFDAPVAATSENIAAALALFEAGRKYNDYGGGTELLPALKRALTPPPARDSVSRSIVVITDGYVDLEAEAYALVHDNLGDANLFAFGIGSSVNRELIERLARAGRTEPTVIENEKRARAAAEKFRKMIESPVLTNVRVEFNGGAVAAPDVLSQRPIVMCGKWPEHTDPSTQVIRLGGQTGAGPWSTEIRAADALDLGAHGTLALLWAREHLADLRDLHALRVDAPKQKSAIIELGLKYNLLTPFTSFVAVDMTPRLSAEAAAQAKKVTQALPLPKGVGKNAIGVGKNAVGMSKNTTGVSEDATGVNENAIGVSEDAADSVPTSPEPETIGLLLVAAMVAAVALHRKHGGKLWKGAA